MRTAHVDNLSWSLNLYVLSAACLPSVSVQKCDISVNTFLIKKLFFMICGSDA